MKRVVALAVLLTACAVPASGPATLDDRAATFSGVEASVAVLQNDWPGTGLTLTNALVVAGGGSAQVSGDRVVYSPADFAGTAEIRYEVMSNGMTADGMLIVDVEGSEVSARSRGDFGEVAVFDLAATSILVEGRAGSTRVGAIADEPLFVDWSFCDIVDAGETCELIVEWSPTEVGERQFQVVVNDQSIVLQGNAVHALEVPEPLDWSAPEESPWSGVFELHNRASRRLAVNAHTTNDLVEVAACRTIDPGGWCDVELSLAEQLPGGEEITGEVVFEYGTDDAQQVLTVPFALTVEFVELEAPRLIRPWQDAIWIEALRAPVTFEWEGRPGPNGWYFEVLYCGAPEECRPIHDNRPTVTEETVFLGDLVETLLVRIEAGLPAGWLQWNVSALGPGDREAPSSTPFMELVLQPIDVRDAILTPPPGSDAAEPTEIEPGDTVELVLRYRSNLLTAASVEMTAEADIFVAIVEEVVCDIPDCGELIAGGEDVFVYDISLSGVRTLRFEMRIPHPADPGFRFPVWSADGFYLFWAPGPD